jgi:hypothetical protein
MEVRGPPTPTPTQTNTNIGWLFYNRLLKSIDQKNKKTKGRTNIKKSTYDPVTIYM